MSKRLLCINPGSTSTRIAVFCDDQKEFITNVKHSNELLETFDGVQNQLDFRYGLIKEELDKAGIDTAKIDAVVGLGGALRTVEGGVYSINEAMLTDCSTSKYAEHPCNLGCQLAQKFALPNNLPSFVVDPPLVDEFDELARMSGLPPISRRSAFHALNEKAIAKFIADKLGQRLTDINIVTAHLGSGISVTAHKRGRCVDNNYGSGGDGPFSPERCGRLPALSLIETLAADEQTSAADWKKSFSKKSGVVSYTGINDMMEMERRMHDGDELARDIYDGMAHYIAREIAAYCTILDWDVAAIGITGAIANSNYMYSAIERRLSFICPVLHYPGEFEMEALAAGGIRALDGIEAVKEY
ncbi:MAG: butyrate kinase [Defluviitaleaceae bacterium]|nr:butyrate kinase [Defluviitaleaceae bacterium]